MTQTPLSPDRRWWWNGSSWVSTLSADGRWRWSGKGWRPVTYPWVRYLAIAGAVLGLVGFQVASAGFLDSCFPGSFSTGHGCYSPPWATPALVLGVAMVIAAILGLAAAVLGYSHARRSQSLPPRT